MDFKNWMMFLEGSFTEADIPPYFYTGCYFSNDFFKKKSYTPPGAAVTLVGLEGLSESASTAFSFWNGAGLKMPGKQVVALNKITRMMYNNPEYIASAGFRAPRRTASGSGGPTHAGNKRVAQSGTIKNAIDRVFEMITSKFPDLQMKRAKCQNCSSEWEYNYNTASTCPRCGSYSTDVQAGIKLKDNSVLSSSTVTELLNKVKPRRIVPGSRTDKEGKQYKPGRAPQKEKNWKNWRGATDMASRIMTILKGFDGKSGIDKPKRLLEKDPNDVPYIVQWAKDAAQSTGGGHKDEVEWIMKRQNLGLQEIIHCSSCDSNVPVPDSSERVQWDRCNNCGTEWESSSKDTGLCPKCGEDNVDRQSGTRCPNCDNYVAVPDYIPLSHKKKQQPRGKKCHNCNAFINIPGHIKSGTYKCPNCMKERGTETQLEVGGKICPQCKKFVPAPKNKTDNYMCPHCDRAGKTPYEFKSSDFDDNMRAASRPMLHVPEGSVLFVQSGPCQDWLMPYIKKIEKEWGRNIPLHEQAAALVEYFELNKVFEVHMVGDSDEAQRMAGKGNLRSYDPNRQDDQEKIKRAIEKGINRQELLQKFLEKQEGISAIKIRKTIANWKNLGIIGIEDGRIKLLEKDMDEDMIMTFNYIKHHPSKEKYEIQDGVNFTDKEIDAALAGLMQREKIQIINGNKYDIKLSEEEMSQISPLEQEIIDLIPKRKYSYPYHFKNDLGTSVEEKEIKHALRMLTLKKKIFKSQLNDIYALYVSEDEPLSPLEEKVLEHLTDWPASTVDSLEEEFKGVSGDDLNKAITGLECREFLTVAFGKIKLNVSKHPAKPGAKAWPKNSQNIIDLLEEHFIGEWSEVSALLKADSNSTNNKLYDLNDKGVIESIEGRVVPSSGARKAKDTVEGQMVAKYIKEVNNTTLGDIKNLISKHGSIYYATTTTESLLTHLEGEVVVSIYDPVKDMKVWSDINKPYKVDISEYTASVRDILLNSDKAMTSEDVSEEYNKGNGKWLSSNGVSHVLAYLKDNQGEVKSDDIWTGQTVWWIKEEAAPKQKSWYTDALMDIIGDRAWLYKIIIKKMHDKTGLEEAYVDRLIQEIQDSKIKSEYFAYSGDYGYVKKGTKIDQNDYRNGILDITKEDKAFSSHELGNILSEIGLPTRGDSGSFISLLNKMTDEKLIEKTFSIKTHATLYHKPGLTAGEEDYQMVIDFVKSKGGICTGSQIYNHIYYDKHLGTAPSIKSLIFKMIERNKLFVLKQPKGDWGTVVVSIDKDTALPSLAEEILKNIPESGISPAELLTKCNFTNSTEFMDEVKKLKEEGKVFEDVHDPDDWWSGTRLLTKAYDQSAHYTKIIDYIAKQDKGEGVPAIWVYNYSGVPDFRVKGLLWKMEKENLIYKSTDHFDWNKSKYFVGQKPQQSSQGIFYDKVMLEKAIVDLMSKNKNNYITNKLTTIGVFNAVAATHGWPNSNIVPEAMNNLKETLKQMAQAGKISQEGNDVNPLWSLPALQSGSGVVK